MHSKATFIRASELDARGPYQRERRRELEAEGLYPPRIRFNCRMNVWVRTEVEAWEKARVAGASDSAIRELIRRLVASRGEAAKEAA